MEPAQRNKEDLGDKGTGMLRGWWQWVGRESAGPAGELVYVLNRGGGERKGAWLDSLVQDQETTCKFCIFPF